MAFLFAVGKEKLIQSRNLIMSRAFLQKFHLRKKIFWREGALWKQFHRDLSADSDAFSVIAQSHNADENVCMWSVDCGHVDFLFAKKSFLSS